MLFKLSAVLLLVGFAACSPYQGYKVYEVIPRDIKDSDFLHALAQKDGYDDLLISKVPNTPAQLMVSPANQQEFEIILKSRDMNYEVVVADVANKLKEDGIEKQTPRGRAARIGFTQYYRHGDINAYLDELAGKYSFVKVRSIGKSYEGRDLKTITVTNGDGVANKKIIFVDAGIHAREWLAPATALYIINQLVENTAAHQNLLKNYDWVILPVVNPDGYEYTHTKERMWRKTRSAGTLCAGTDANRNFGFHWGEVGASSSACSDTYRGKQAFSEVETQAVRDELLNLKGRVKFYLTLHTYGNYLLYPWGWTSDLPSTWQDLDDVAQIGAAAMKANSGSKWTYGSSTRVLYAAAGGSDDWAFAEAGAPISMTMELQGSGFDPKPTQIQNYVTDSWVGIKAMAARVMDKY